MSMLEALYFGFDDAERDFASGLLNSSFVETPFYQTAKDGRKELILGRKGTGKSAVCLMLEQALAQEHIPAFLITPDALSVSQIQRFQDLSSNPEDSMKIVWHYALLVHIAKYLADQLRQGTVKSAPASKKKLLAFLRDNKHIDTAPVFSRIGHTIGQLKKVSFKAFGIELGIEKEHIPAAASISESLVNLQQLIATILDDNPESPRLFLLLDKLDDLWNDTAESDMMIIGLIRACREINTALRGVFTCIFLRSDIFDTLEFHDYDKFHGTEELIGWHHKTLRTLICRRIRSSTQQTGSDSEAWNSVFAENVLNTDSFSFIVSRTLCRPRDLIQFCNLCQENAQRNAHSVIEASDVTDAEKRYSQWKLQDMVIEYRINYPFLKDLLLGFKRKPARVPRPLLLLDLERSKRVLAEPFPQVADLNPKTLVQLLYKIGFLGTGTAGGEKYFYDDPSIDVETESFLVIHPCFRSALDCTEHDKLAPYFSVAHEIGHSISRIPTMFEEIQIRGFRSAGAFELERDSQHLEALIEELRKVQERFRTLEDNQKENSDVPPAIEGEDHGPVAEG